MRFKKVICMFKSGNVCVTGLRGTGKDLLFGNVIVRRKSDYVSNLNYGGKFHEADFSKLDCGKNTYKEFISGNLNYYSYPYPIGSDIYISDCGIYFPSQYCSQLNNQYGYMATYQALSRQVSHNNFHVNAQNLNRVWDKIREQSDMYIRCRACIYIFGLVIQFITIYDKYESAVNRVKPCRVHVPLFNPQAKMQARTHLDTFHNTHGLVRNRVLLYINRSKHDTYYFEKLLKGEKELHEKRKKRKLFKKRKVAENEENSLYYCLCWYCRRSLLFRIFRGKKIQFCRNRKRG